MTDTRITYRRKDGQETYQDEDTTCHHLRVESLDDFGNEGHHGGHQWNHKDQKWELVPFTIVEEVWQLVSSRELHLPEDEEYNG
jgi:hypothetical protein